MTRNKLHGAFLCFPLFAPILVSYIYIYMQHLSLHLPLWFRRTLQCCLTVKLQKYSVKGKVLLNFISGEQKMNFHFFGSEL